MATTELTQTPATATPPTTLFQGYDIFTNSGMSTAVEGTSASLGGVTRCNYYICTNYSEVQQALDISASVSAMCDFGTVDAKTQFAQSLNITTYIISIVAYTDHITTI